MKVYPFVNLKLTVMCLHLQVYSIEIILKNNSILDDTISVQSSIENDDSSNEYFFLSIN